MRTHAASIAALYDAHVHEVYRFVYRRCQDHSLAEDVTQETFTRALRGSKHPSDVTVGWLITVARNLLIDTLRRKAKYDDRLHLLAGSDTGGTAVEVAERLRVEDALQQLSVNYRLVLTLHYMDGYSVPALAKELGKTPKSVEAIVTRARRALRAELAHDEDGGEGRD